MEATSPGDIAPNTLDLVVCCPFASSFSMFLPLIVLSVVDLEEETGEEEKKSGGLSISNLAQDHGSCQTYPGIGHLHLGCCFCTSETFVTPTI